MLLTTADHYLLFDFPGQVELFSLHSNAKNVISKLVRDLDLRVCQHSTVHLFVSCGVRLFLSMIYFIFLQLAAVHLVDSHLCSDPGKYVSALLLSLTTMIHLELPHINVLSKIDLIESYGKLGVLMLIVLLFSLFTVIRFIKTMLYIQPTT